MLTRDPFHKSLYGAQSYSLISAIYDTVTPNIFSRKPPKSKDHTNIGFMDTILIIWFLNAMQNIVLKQRYFGQANEGSVCMGIGRVKGQVS